MDTFEPAVDHDQLRLAKNWERSPLACEFAGGPVRHSLPAQTNRSIGRIALFLPSLNCGGAERATLRLAAAFAANGIEVDLVLASAEGPYLRQVPSHIRVVDLVAGRVLASLPGLVRYLRQCRPAALLSAMEHANLVALLARGIARVSTRVVVSIRITVSEDSQKGQPLRGRLATAWAGAFYRAAHGVVAVSDGVADDFARTTGFPRSGIRTIYNPVVAPELLKLAQAQVNHPWFAPDGVPVILGVGRLVPQKDFPTLIEAFAQVRSERSARLLILGDGEKRFELNALVRKLGLGTDVCLSGYIENPFAYMRRCAVFVLSSAYEGLPNSLIEAMACGAPVISTNCPSGPAEILEDGRYGALVPVGDVKAMAAEIAAALQNRPDTARSTRRAQAFSAEASAAQYLEMLLGGSSVGERAA